MNDAFYQNMTAMIESIEDCLEKRRLVPCLALLYTGIDVMASLERQSSENQKAAFLRWVEKYFLKILPLPCTAMELYAARCGILHTFTHESDLSRQRKARMLMYAWGTAVVGDLDKAAAILKRDDVVSVHVSDLISAFRGGIVAHIEELARNEQRQTLVEKRAGLWFKNTQPDVILGFIKGYEEQGAS